MSNSQMSAGLTETTQLDATTHQVTNMAYSELVKYTTDTINNKDDAYFKIGAALMALNATKEWKDTYNNFSDFVLETFALGKRQAYHYIDIYEGLIESGLDFSQVSSLGMTKLRILSTVFLKKIGDPLEWVEKAENVTTYQLQEMVKIAIANASEETGSDEVPEVSTTTNMTFKVHADQKETIEIAIEAAKKDYSTEHKTVALEHICLAFNATEAGVPQSIDEQQVKAFAKEAGFSFIAELIDELWPDIDVEITLP